MAVRKIGFKRVEKLLNEMPKTARKHFAEANEDNANAVVRVARVLVQEGKTARAKAAIKATPEGDTGQMIDFGPLSSILEGGTKERQHKSGKSTGKGPKLPFVNPALKATEDMRRKRYQKAARDAVREAKRNGGGDA